MQNLWQRKNQKIMVRKPVERWVFSFGKFWCMMKEKGEKKDG